MPVIDFQNDTRNPVGRANAKIDTELSLISRLFPPLADQTYVHKLGCGQRTDYSKSFAAQIKDISKAEIQP